MRLNLGSNRESRKDADMTLSVPNYIRASDIQDSTIRYEWDDWKTLPALQAVDDELVSRLKKVSQRSVLAFMCGTAEWIYYRLAKLCDDRAPADYLEGAWAMLVNVRYCGYGDGDWWQQYSVKGWTGPIKRPITKALERLEVAIQNLAWEHTDPVRQGGLIAALAIHIMPHTAPYKRWCGQVLDRLESLYPRTREDQLGDVVPRQALDPQFDFKIEQTETLINEFLASLDYRRNIFLSSPEGMLEPDDSGESFRGTPYVFDLKADRRARQRTKLKEDDK